MSTVVPTEAHHELAVARNAERLARTQLDLARAEVERLKNQRDNLLKPMREQAIARADQAELRHAQEQARAIAARADATMAQAELAKERARFVRFITLADTWETQINDTQRVIENPEAQHRAGVLEINRLRTVNDVRRDMLKDLLNTTKEYGK